MGTIIEIKIITQAESLSPDILEAIRAIADSSGATLSGPQPPLAGPIKSIREQAPQAQPAAETASVAAKAEEKLSADILRNKIASLTANTNPNMADNKAKIKGWLKALEVKSVSEAADKCTAEQLTEFYNNLKTLS